MRPKSWKSHMVWREDWMKSLYLGEVTHKLGGQSKIYLIEAPKSGETMPPLPPLGSVLPGFHMHNMTWLRLSSIWPKLTCFEKRKKLAWMMQYFIFHCKNINKYVSKNKKNCPDHFEQKIYMHQSKKEHTFFAHLPWIACFFMTWEKCAFINPENYILYFALSRYVHF